MSRAIRAERRQLLLLPPSVDELVGADHPVRFVEAFVRSLNLAELGMSDPDEDERGRPAFAAEMKLGVWVYGYFERIRSTRRLERACESDLAMRWLTGGHVIDHNTLWLFFDQHRGKMKKLFRQVVLLARDEGLLGMALHAVDGTKILTASSNRTAMHANDLREEVKRLDEQIARQLAEIDTTRAHEAEGHKLPEALRDAQERAARIRAGLARLEQAEREHLHPSEPEARMMRKHGRTDLAYNAQVVSDAELQVVVAAEVETVETDNHLLVPMLENVKATVGAVATTTLADAGYFSGEQLAEAEARGLDVKVAMPKVAARETDEFHRDRFTYDNTRDVYVCPTGELLAREREMKKRGVLLTVYRCKNTECPVRDACTKSKDGRMIQRSEHEASFARRRAEARSSPGRESMRQRGAIVEPVFAQIKTLDGFTRFTVRGIEKARAQWALVCAAYDLRKLYTFWRTGSLQLA